MCGTTDKYKGQVRYVLKYTPVIEQGDDYFNTEIASSIRKKVIKSTYYDGTDDTKLDNLIHTFTDNTWRAEKRCFKTYEDALDYAVKHNTETIKELQKALNTAIKKGLQHDVKRT
jgi:hypothetical protein